jgi:hypothetical protein
MQTYNSSSKVFKADGCDVDAVNANQANYIRHNLYMGYVTYMILPLVRSTRRSKDIASVDFPVIYSA